MTFRDDGEALHARIRALEQELAEEKKARLAAEAEIEAERARRREDLRAARAGREKLAGRFLLVPLVALAVLCGILAVIGYNEMGRLHDATATSNDWDQLATLHRAELVGWAGNIAVVALSVLGGTLLLVHRTKASAVVGAIASFPAMFGTLMAGQDWSTLGVVKGFLGMATFFAAMGLWHSDR